MTHTNQFAQNNVRNKPDGGIKDRYSHPKIVLDYEEKVVPITPKHLSGSPFSGIVSSENDDQLMEVQMLL